MKRNEEIHGGRLIGFPRAYLLALPVGLIAGSLGAAFHYCLDQAYAFHTAIAAQLGGETALSIVAASLIGAVMTVSAYWMVVRFAPEAGGSGIQEIEGAMAGLRTMRWVRVMIVKFVGGILAIGAGLVLGREGPTVHMGGCVGKWIGEKTNADPETMNTLLAAGAAAGLSAAFGAPLASILFVMEEMRNRFHFSFIAIHAVAIASLTAKVMNDQVFGIGPLLPIELKFSMSEIAPFPQLILEQLPLYVGLGILIGICGAGFNTSLLACLAFFDRMSSRARFLFALVLGGLAGALMLLAPSFVGGGGTFVQAVFANTAFLHILVVLLIVRTGMTFLSYSSGVPGGIFAPMLAIGAIIGMCFGVITKEYVPYVEVPPGVFALAAMGGLFAATVRAPLTGIVLVAELTSSFDLLGVLIVTCIVASITAQLLGSKPIYDSLLDRTLSNAAKLEEAKEESEVASIVAD
ncbi:H(+)/Cl(-) exchange transporter ClcA [Blastopirellula sp. JC732]|uniref:H(+)/Cl(-) exchange transporter ClcA n=1 Tax=Blastopirellula sediminis TaxID=2894196 RepID=A0A9X1MLK8_9BACT|nr:H(+)/Cl(-) exchange transporter ClcA [Blastopirellula sediminis]MCC9608392.1 H(+)/Cl(-) exchange transporter ClcA [Blastopirellula sediminis]MCC9628831.1 H(+)/Cl(-) exchange transporter ClcA [Blastopirellula sediminis]